MTWGFTTRSTNDNLQTYETFASVGYNNKKTYWEKVDVEFTFDGYLPLMSMEIQRWKTSSTRINLKLVGN